MTDSEYRDSSMHPVRPRWVWLGLGALVLGLATVAVGIMATSLVVIVPGLLVLTVGAAGALYGGLYYDTRGRSQNVVSEVRDGPEYSEPGPEARARDEKAQAKSRELDVRRRQLLETSQRSGWPSLLPIGVVVILTVCLWLLVAQWSVYPTSATGQNNALRDLGLAIILALGAIRLGLAAPRRWISVAMAAGGVALVAFGLGLAHDSTAVATSEVICGGLVILGALLTLDQRPVRRETP